MDMRKNKLEAGMAEDALPECLRWCTVDCITRGSISGGSALAKAPSWNNPGDKDNPSSLLRAAQDLIDWLESGRSKEVGSGQLVDVATERKESALLGGKLRRYAVQLGHIDTLKTTPPSKVAMMDKDLVVFQADLLEDVDADEYPHRLFQYLTFSDSIAIGPAGVISEMRKWIRTYFCTRRRCISGQIKDWDQGRGKPWEAWPSCFCQRLPGMWYVSFLYLADCVICLQSPKSPRVLADSSTSF